MLLAALLAVLITGCRGGSERDVMAALLSNTPGPDVLPDGYWNTYSHDIDSAWPSDGTVGYSFELEDYLERANVSVPRFAIFVANFPDTATALETFESPIPTHGLVTLISGAEAPAETAQFEAGGHSVRCFEGKAPQSIPGVTEQVQQCVVAVDRFLISSEVVSEIGEETLAPGEHWPFLSAAIRHVEAVAGLGE